MERAVTFIIGQIVTALQLLSAPVGLVVRAAEGGGFEVIEVPEEKHPYEDLAWELYQVFNPDTTMEGLSNGYVADMWRNVAQHVSENFARVQEETDPVPVELVDRDGDLWFLCDDGRYGIDMPRTKGTRYLGELYEKYPPLIVRAYASSNAA